MALNSTLILVLSIINNPWATSSYQGISLWSGATYNMYLMHLRVSCHIWICTQPFQSWWDPIQDRRSERACSTRPPNHEVAIVLGCFPSFALATWNVHLITETWISSYKGNSLTCSTEYSPENGGRQCLRAEVLFTRRSRCTEHAPVPVFRLFSLKQ